MDAFPIPTFSLVAAKVFVNPNLHVALVHYPIALLIVGTLVEVFSFLGWRGREAGGGFRNAGRWMILLGAITMLPAAMSGVYAIVRVTRDAFPGLQGMSWREVLEVSPLVKDSAAWEHMTNHAWIQSIASVIVLLVVVIWLGATDRMRGRIHLPLVFILLFGCALVTAGAWHGGEGVYRNGVAVMRERDRSPTSNASSASNATTKPAADESAPETENDAASSATGALDRATATFNYFLPPLDAHVAMAGFTISLALVSLGLAVRGAGAPPVNVEGVHDIAAALAPFDTSTRSAYDTRDRHPSIDRIESRRRFPGSVPPARFWMLTGLAAALTSLLGIYFFAGDMGTWNARALMTGIYDPSQPMPLFENRRLAHVIVGASIVVLTLLLALFGRWAPRRKGTLFILAVLLIASLVSQAWLGGLLLFDGTDGRVTKLK